MTEENGNAPRIFSWSAFVLLLVFGVGLIVSAAFFYYRELALLAAPTRYGAHELIALTNGSRIAEGKAVLTVSNTLIDAAGAKLEHMLAGQYFAHTAPDGTLPWEFVHDTGYTYTAAGENLARDFVTAERAHEAFMASPTHRANIVHNAFTEVGIAVGQGSLDGRPVILIVQYFAAPARVPTRLAVPLSGVAEAAGQPVSPEENSETLLGAGEGFETAVEPVPTEESIEDHAVSLIAPITTRTSNYQAGATIIALVGFAVVLVAFMSMLLGSRFHTQSAVIRAMILLLLLGYAAFFAHFNAPFAEITSQAVVDST